MLYFAEHTDPMLREFYLFTDEKEPNMYDSYLCFLVEIKTLHLGEYKGESRIQVNSKYIRNLVPMNELPAEEMWGERKMMKRFLYTMKLILKNI